MPDMPDIDKDTDTRDSPEVIPAAPAAVITPAQRLAALLAPEPPPAAERILVVPRLVATGDAEPRYLFVRWADWPYPALLSVEPPRADDTIEDAVGSLLQARLHVALRGPVRLASMRLPVRMPMPRYGAVGVGWLRPAAVEVEGDPAPDALLEGFELLTLDEALAALPTDVERAALREAAALF